MLTRVAVNQTVGGVVAITLTAIIAAGIVSADSLSILQVGWAPLLAFATYFGGMRLLHLNRQAPPFETIAEAKARIESAISLRVAVLGFILAATVIVLAVRLVAESSAELADKYDVSQGFVGVALLAITTSLPELSVTVPAVKRGSYDLAVGNLLGSNCFNVAIPFVLDLAYRDGSLLLGVEPAVTTSGMFAILLTAMTPVEIMHRSERRVWLIEPDALVRIGIYIFGIVMVFRAGG